MTSESKSKPYKRSRTATSKWQLLDAALPRIPKFIEGIDIVKSSDSIQFRAGDKPLTLRGEMVNALSPLFTELLSGKNSVHDIIEILGKRNRGKIYYALWLLHTNNLLEDENTVAKERFSNEELELLYGQLAFFGRHLNVTKSFENKYEAQLAIRDSKVLMLGGGLLLSKVIQILDEIGVGNITVLSNDMEAISLCRGVAGSVRHSKLEFNSFNPKSDRLDSIVQDHNIDLLGVATPKPVPDIYNQANAACLLRNIQWTRLTMTGSEILIGPTIVPFKTACYTCFNKRFEANNPYFEEDQIYMEYLNNAERQSNPKSEYLSLSELAARLFSFEIIRILTFLSSPISYGALYSMDFLTGKTHISKVLKIPRCPSCSNMNILPGRYLLPRLFDSITEDEN